MLLFQIFSRQIDLIGSIKFFHILYSLIYQTLKKLLTDSPSLYSRSDSGIGLLKMVYHGSGTPLSAAKMNLVLCPFE